MAKVLVTLDDRLLSRIDARARKLGMSRSAYLADLAERDLGTARGPGATARVRHAMARLERLFAENPTPGDVTQMIREMRDSR